MGNFADILISAIKEKGNPCVVGLDYHENRLPTFVSDELRRAPSPEGYRNTISGFFRRIIDTVAPLVPAVKPQISLLESMTWVGTQIFIDIVESAKQHGLIVIADAKRSDIASSAQGYAKAFLGKREGPKFARGYDVHAMTVNPFLGRDTLEPYIDVCKTFGKGIFVLVKTSNKGSTETQDVMLKEPSDPMYVSYARMVAEVGASLIGESGYSSVGAVVGATFREQAEQIRKLMPKAIILVPGYGAQGATSEDVAVCFNEDGLGAVVNSSRGITAKFKQPNISPKEYVATVKDNTLKMIDDITPAVERKQGR